MNLVLRTQTLLQKVFRRNTTIFPTSNNTSGDSTLQIELNYYREVANELIGKVVALQTDRQLSKERETALLELLSFYRKEMLRTHDDLRSASTTEEFGIPEIVCISPTTAKSSDGSLPSNDSYERRWPSPENTAIYEPRAEEDITLYILEGSEAIKTLQTLSASSAVLSLFRATSQEELHQTAAAGLEQVSGLVSRFAGDVASLRSLCVRSQDALVADIVGTFMANATATLRKFTDPTQPNPGHPMELTLCFHGLPGALENICKQSWCLGNQSKYCIHRLSAGMNELMSVTMVHPGKEWKDLQLCLFAGLKGATLLQGDIFSLVGTAHIRERWSYEFFDETSWEEVFHNTNLVDIFWEIPDDNLSPETGSFSNESEAAHQLFNETGRSTFEFTDTQSAHSVSSSALDESSSELEALEQAEDVLAELELIHDDGPLKLETLEYAEAALAELEHQAKRRGYAYLRAGEGANASRNASFISAREVTIRTPKPPRGPYPYLKRGDGLRRRSHILVSPSKKQEK